LARAAVWLGEVGPPEEATAIEKAAAEFKVPAPIWGRGIVSKSAWIKVRNPASIAVQARPERDLESTPQAARARQ
jgi:hypothetical protein